MLRGIEGVGDFDAIPGDWREGVLDGTFGVDAMLAPLDLSLALEDFDGPPNDFTERELDGTLGVDAMLAPLERSFAFEDFDAFDELGFTK